MVPVRSDNHVDAAAQDRRDRGETVTYGFQAGEAMAGVEAAKVDVVVKTATASVVVESKALGAPGQPVASREAAHAVAAQIMGAAGRRPDHVASRTPPQRDTLFVALRTFDYNGRHLDRGQVFTFEGCPGDARLRDLRYVVEHDGGTLYECPQCSERFNVAGLRDGHARTRHVKSQYRPPAPPIREPGESIDNYQNRLDEWAQAAGAAADAADERRDKIENEIAPLDLEKTAASRNA